MNLILFEEEELHRKLDFTDPRVMHIERILGLDKGDVFSAGIIDGQIGEARLLSRDTTGWDWTFIPTSESPPLHPLTLVLGCPRPPVARRLLKDMSSLGLKEIRSCATDLNEKSYLTAKLWRDGLWRNAIIEGAMQGVSTYLPDVETANSLERGLKNLPTGPGCLRVALDNGPDTRHWPPQGGNWTEAILAIGPERGWSERERALLKAEGFVLISLGIRIMRTETACAVGSGLILSALGNFNEKSDNF